MTDAMETLTHYHCKTGERENCPVRGNAPLLNMGWETTLGTYTGLDGHA